MDKEEKLSLTTEEQKKAIIIEFLGGFKDGLELRTDSEKKNESDQAFFMYLAFSKRGKLGSKFRTVSDAGVQEMMEIIEHTPEGPRLTREPTMEMNHFYEVTDRQEDDETIRVVYRYMGQKG